LERRSGQPEAASALLDLFFRVDAQSASARSSREAFADEPAPALWHFFTLPSTPCCSFAVTALAHRAWPQRKQFLFAFDCGETSAVRLPDSSE